MQFRTCDHLSGGYYAILTQYVPQFRNVDPKVTQGLECKTNKFDILYRKRSVVVSYIRTQACKLQFQFTETNFA